MKRILFISLWFIIPVLAVAAGENPGRLAVIPRPLSMQYENTTLHLKQVFSVSDKSSPKHSFAEFLNSVSLPGLEYKCIESARGTGDITINISSGTGVRESYILEIRPEGIHINAQDYAGALYAIETLKQLLVQAWNGIGFDLPCMVIQDEPAFRFRGFMLDASRHFQPVATVKHVLDYMLSMKLNVFHWHLSDDQGWRVQSLKHPELNISGSFMNYTDRVQTNGFYTIEEIHDIIEYAKARNIQIIPECDIPGHSMAILTAFPGLRCPYKPESNAFCAGNPDSYKIIKDIFGELIEIFRPEYIHIGGDERQKDLWNKCDLCLAKMKEVGVTNENDLQNKMLIEISDFIHSKGVRTIAWAENLEGGIAKGQVIQSWRLKDEAYKSIKMGHQVVNSDNGECYLDYPENAEEAKSKPSWMLILPVEKVYNFDPVPAGLTSEEEKLVIGSECPLWTEQITIDLIYPQIRDRLEAHAEKCWTLKELKNYGGFSARLDILRPYFKSRFYAEIPDMCK
jgi:hexosaminidase